MATRHPAADPAGYDVPPPGYGSPAGGEPGFRPRADVRPPKPRKKRGEKGHVMSRPTFALTVVLALAVPLLLGIAPVVEGSVLLGRLVAFVAAFLLFGVTLEAYARHRYAVRRRGRTKLRTRARVAGSAGRSWWAELRDGGDDDEADGEVQDDRDDAARGGVWLSPDRPDRPAESPVASGPGNPVVSAWPQFTPGAPAASGATGPQPAAVSAPARSAPPVIRVPVTPRGPVPKEWTTVAAAVGGYVPDNDTDLLAWLAGQIRGTSELAAAYVQVFESSVTQKRLTTAAIGALHDTGDHVAQLADLIAKVRTDFLSYYEGYRQWAASGGVSPNDPDFITGQD
jgi:hypothetical protein